MADRAGLEQGLALQGADQLVAVVDRAVLAHFDLHVAVGAAHAVGRVDALEDGFKLGMLGLEHMGAGAGLDPVVEADSAVLVRGRVVIGQDRLRGHLRDAVIGHHGLVVRLAVLIAVHGGEVILDVALAAGEHAGVDGLHVFAQGLGDVGVGHLEGALAAGLVAVAGVAGDALAARGDLLIDLVEILRVDAHALILNHFREGGGLAGQAAGQGFVVDSLGLSHVRERVGVAAGGAVVLGKAVALVDVDQIGVLLQIIDDLVVVAVVKQAVGQVGEELPPGLGGNRSVGQGLLRGLHGDKVDVGPGQRAQIAAVGQVIVSVLFPGQGRQQDHGQGHNDQGDDDFVDENLFIHGFLLPPSA